MQLYKNINIKANTLYSPKHSNPYNQRTFGEASFLNAVNHYNKFDVKQTILCNRAFATTAVKNITDETRARKYAL